MSDSIMKIADEMAAMVADAKRAIETAETLERQMPSGEEHSRVMEQIAISRTRATIIDQWATRLRALSPAPSEPTMARDGEFVMVRRESLLIEAKRLRYRADETCGFGPKQSDAGAQMVHTAEALEAFASPLQPCKTCNGYGMIGYTTGQTPEQFEQHEVECPDCQPKPTIAGGGEWVMVPREPTRELLAVLEHERFPADWEAGKVMQRQLGFDVIPPRTESEIAAGQYLRLLAAATQPQPTPTGADRVVNFRGESFADVRQALVNLLKAQKSWVTAYAEVYVDEFIDMSRLTANSADTREGELPEFRLWDSQWVNIVNHENCYRDFDIEDAVAMAVKLTEQAMARNVSDSHWPPARLSQGGPDNG